MKYVPLREIVPKKLTIKQARARLRRSRYHQRDGRWMFSEKTAPSVQQYLNR